MTIREVSSQLCNIAVGGRINGTRFTCAQLEAALRRWLREPGASYIMEIQLPDGRWACKVTRGPYGYDYYIPTTRAEDAQLWRELGWNSKAEASAKAAAQ